VPVDPGYLDAVVVLGREVAPERSHGHVSSVNPTNTCAPCKPVSP
jgi:hypothetical protein